MSYQEFNGFRFNKDISTGYYKGWVNGVIWSMHRYVWYFYNGEIPKGYHVHHKDGDKANNSIDNLECIDGYEHLSQHTLERMHNGEIDVKANLDKARIYASIWHGSEEGRKWHSEHSKEVWKNMPVTTKICDCCGKEFEININSASHTRFCSNKCKSKWRRDNGLDNVTKICPICGKEFTISKYSKTKTCGKECGRKLLSITKRKANKER